MREFFQGWRRKTGLALLAMALLLTAAWMRSRVLSNSIGIRRGGEYSSIHSSVGRLAWVEIYPVHKGILEFSDTSLSQKFLDDAVAIPARMRGGTIEWQWKWFGFDFSARTSSVFVHSATEQLHVVIWTVPYWSHVLPLTLLSAFLIFSKPRHSKSAMEPKRG